MAIGGPLLRVIAAVAAAAAAAAAAEAAAPAAFLSARGALPTALHRPARCPRKAPSVGAPGRAGQGRWDGDWRDAAELRGQVLHAETRPCVRAAARAACARVCVFVCVCASASARAGVCADAGVCAPV